MKCASLSLPCQRLVRLMQFVNYGRIENLTIRRGEPIFETGANPALRIYRTLKLAAENAPRPEASLSDFLVKRELVELFNCIAKQRDGMIRVIEIRHGLPFLMEVEEPVSEELT